MTVAYVTFPGTSGNYVDTADTNLLSSNYAHNHQAIGSWGQNSNCTITATPQTPPVAPPFGTTAMKLTATANGAESSIFSGATTNILVSPSTQYTVSAWVYTDVASRQARVRAQDYDTSDVAGTSTGTTDDFLALVVGEWTQVSLTFTTAADAARLRLTVYFDADPHTGSVSAGDVWYVSTMCLRLGADSSFVPSLRIVGDLDMRARFAATDATPASAETLIGQRSGNSGYAMTLGTGGELVVYHGTGSGTRQETSSGLSLSAATATEVQSTLDISTGTWTHYKNGVQFDSSGSFATTAGSPYAGPLAVGADSAGTSGNWDGDIYYAEVRDGIDGPVVRRFDADDLIGLV